MKTLTEKQRAQWASDGYFQMEQVLSPDEVAFFSEQVDRMREKPGWGPAGSGLPRGHYEWVQSSPNQDPESFDADAWPTPHTPGAVQLTGKAGDCCLFPHSLWHGPTSNSSGRARKTLLYNYCQMFVRWYDFELTAEVKEKCTPRQRRLPGDLGHDFRPGSYFYAPEDRIEVIYQGAAPALEARAR